MAPKTGDNISGSDVGWGVSMSIVKIEDYGHDTAMKYTLANGQAIYACHWDFDKMNDGTFRLNPKDHSNWGS